MDGPAFRHYLVQSEGTLEDYMITAACVAALAAMAYTTIVTMRSHRDEGERRAIRIRVEEDKDRPRR